MKFRVKKAQLMGEIAVPASKSQTLRAVLFGAMGKGRSIITGGLDSGDVRAMIEACRLFGAKVQVGDGRIVIDGVDGKIAGEGIINAGNSGIVLRFCAAIGALGNGRIVLTGDASLKRRPMGDLIQGLNQLGVEVTDEKGFAPVSIKGPLQCGKVILSGQDSQPVSAVLIAGAFADGPIELHVTDAGEKPWVSLTLDWFDRLGISYKRQGFERYWMTGGAGYDGFTYEVPGDLSSAAFPIAAALLTGSEVILRNVDLSDMQGDKELIRVFQKMGGVIEVDGKSVSVKKGNGLKGVRVDINDFVDGITILAVVGCFAEGETVIYNGTVAKQKECNRIACIVKELKKMGADVEESEDGLKVRKSTLKGALVHSYHDHRMAMSLAVAGLGADGETVVTDMECISKTFPTFLRDFNALGAKFEAIG